jgi:hypothetical protein
MVSNRFRGGHCACLHYSLILFQNVYSSLSVVQGELVMKKEILG